MTTKIATRQKKESPQAEGLEAVETAPVSCGFCQGKGRDPFGIMSALASCCVCGGSGTVALKTPYTRCAFCQGTGVYPGTRLTCTACGGVGVSPVPQPNKACPHCLGTGAEPHSEATFYCLTCHGTGVVGNGAQFLGNRG